MPFDFQPLTNFRLARGSHKQPNKDGNICVNEAAVIAAGFEYRAVRDVSCLPDCFSRPAFRNKLGPDADRTIWQIAINILEEAILLGRHDGIGDVMAAAERLERAKPPLVSAVVWG